MSNQPTPVQMKESVPRITDLLLASLFEEASGFLWWHGFPSSKKKNLIIEKAQLFFPKDLQDRALKLIVYSLGYVDADGCLGWDFAHDGWPPEVQLNRIKFIARDKTFLDWLASEFRELGMKPSVLQQSPSLQALFLYKTDAKAMELFKQAFYAMKKANIPIAGNPNSSMIYGGGALYVSVVILILAMIDSSIVLWLSK